MKHLKDFLLENATGDLIPWRVELMAAAKFDMSYLQVERAALSFNLLPARYQRNRKTISLENQLKLLESKVVVIGCGGLGGYVIEELARLGVGSLVVVDPDVFEEHNLNRQILSKLNNLGKYKSDIAEAHIKEINPAVVVNAINIPFSLSNGKRLFKNADVVVDALDDICVRLDLAEICNELSMPMVHGAIAGWFGQVCSWPSGKVDFTKIYNKNSSPKGIEVELGNPSFTPAVIASLQVAEVTKILLNTGCCLENRMLLVDLLNMKVDEMDLDQAWFSKK